MNRVNNEEQLTNNQMRIFIMISSLIFYAANLFDFTLLCLFYLFPSFTREVNFFD